MTDNGGGKTITFSLQRDKDKITKEIISAVYAALVEKGYDPINQIVGYILSEDPTYITNHKNARSLISKIDRDELLRQLLINYLK
ncbi:MAG: IreB family regulatory phosphoprotein [Oscillospiraceae bacterium]|nr:IreB family regulatory phosphoprotein [Oscillospiraceae bacterium]